MKSYDDLQRFKEKTLTNHIEFKDMSEQTRNADNTNWAIIRQLMNEGAEPALGNGQRTDIAAPQPAAADLFSQPAVVKTPVKASAPLPASVAAFVAAKPAAHSGSLLESISASLKPAAQPVAPSPQEAALPRQSSHAQAASPQKTSLLDAVRAQSSTATSPQNALPQDTVRTQLSTAASVQNASLLDAVRAQPAPSDASHAATAFSSEANQEARFKPLFSVSGARTVEKALPKETLLQPLLEKIASCR